MAMTRAGGTPGSTMKRSARRHCSGWPSRLPRIATRPFMIMLFGMTSVSQLRVSMRRERAGLAEHPDQEEPQRVQVDRAFGRAEPEQQHRQRECQQGEPRHFGVQERAKAILLAHQNLIRPLSMSRHIAQSPMKLYKG